MTDRTMQRWWRRAVLTVHKNKCAVCGRIREPEELECHHLVKRRYRILRHDDRNGVPVCKGKCHSYADTTAGTAEILSKHKWADYLNSVVRDFRTVKDYLVQKGITQKQMDEKSLEELKTLWEKQ